MTRDYFSPFHMVECIYCHKVWHEGQHWVIKVDGKWFCNNKKRCVNAYIRNGHKPKELAPKVKKPKKTKKGGKSLYRR